MPLGLNTILVHRAVWPHCTSGSNEIVQYMKGPRWHFMICSIIWLDANTLSHLLQFFVVDASSVGMFFGSVIFIPYSAIRFTSSCALSSASLVKRWLFHSSSQIGLCLLKSPSHIVCVNRLSWGLSWSWRRRGCRRVSVPLFYRFYSLGVLAINCICCIFGLFQNHPRFVWPLYLVSLFVGPSSVMC